jgi:chemotaxis protein MotA
MLVIIGFVVVLGSIIVGFMWHGGNPLFLFVPNEYLIIIGSAIGALLIANNMNTVKKVISGILGTLKGAKVSKPAYIDLLKLLYELFQFAKREGLIALEPHVEVPESSTILSKYPSFLSNHHAVEFLCDTLKVILSGGVPAHDLEELMDLDLEVHHAEEAVPPGALSSTADAFPGLGIVAAVLGIIITMGKINAGAEAVGSSVGSALVGTFLGVLLSYGFVGPLAKAMENNMMKESRYLQVTKAALLSFAKGAPAAVAIEYGRRSIDPEFRPTFKETEEAIKQK